jgi:hypothetical protein
VLQDALEYAKLQCNYTRNSLLSSHQLIKSEKYANKISSGVEVNE